MNKRTLVMLAILGVAAAALIALYVPGLLDSSKPATPVAPPPKVPAPVAGKVAAPSAQAGDSVAKPAGEARKIAYVYDMQGKRDPFVPLVLPKVEKGKEERQRGPAVIGQYELAEIKLIGIVSRNGQAFGVLQTPDGRSYTVHEGLRLGDATEVFRINANSLTVRETYRDKKGSVKVKDTTLRLRKEEG